MQSARFSVNSFQYNGRVASALVPCLFIMFSLGGQPVVACLAIGAMISYMMDTLQYREGAFACSWATLIITYIVFLVSILLTSEAPAFLIFAVVLASFGAISLMGMWISLQFRWILMQHPAITLAFEHIIMTGSFPCSAMLLTIGLSEVVNATELPYYVAVLMGCMYYTLGRPLPSSFTPPAKSNSVIGGTSKSNSVSVALQTKADAALAAISVVLLPGTLYAMIHWAVLTRSIHLYSLCILFSVPLLYICVLPGGLWWLPGPTNSSNLSTKLLLLFALFLLLVGFEGRVVFHSFRQYIKIQPPWDWVAVSFALFGSAGVGIIHYFGVLGRTIDVTLAGSVLLLCTTAGALAAGMPFSIFPAPLIGACGLALFLDSRGLHEYLVFALGAFLTGAWFVYHPFWLLDIMLGTMHLHTFCKLVVVAFVPALLLPGLVLARAPKALTATLLLAQACLIGVLEEELYGPSHEELADESMYPAYLVLATSALGCMATRSLAVTGHVTTPAAWAAAVIYLSKASMLVLPEAGLVVPTTLMLLSSTAPLVLYNRALKRKARIPPAYGVAHALSVFFSLVLARFALFDLVQFLLSSRPGEGVLAGSLLLALAAGLAPLVWSWYSHQGQVVRALGVLAVAGGLLVLLRPPFPVAGGARCPKLPLALCPRLWDERHIPLHDLEDVEVWGTGAAPRSQWPRWLLVAAIMSGVLVAAAGGSSANSIRARLTLATASGLLVGCFLALEVVPYQLPLQIFLVLANMLAMLFVALLLIPDAANLATLPSLLLGWVFTFAVTVLLQAELPVPQPAISARLFPDSPQAGEEEAWTSARYGVLAIFAAHCLLIAFALRMKQAAVLRNRHAYDAGLGSKAAMDDGHGIGFALRPADLFCSFVPANLFSTFGRMLQMSGTSGLEFARLSSASLGWAPTVANIAALLAFGLVLILSGAVTGGAPEAIFMLAPLLLLLGPDPLLLPGLGPETRYVPPVLAAVLYLVMLDVVQMLDMLGSKLVLKRSATLFLLTNFAMLALTLPSLALCLDYLWTSKVRPLVWLLLAAPPALLPLCLSALPPARYLAALALLAAPLQAFAMRHNRQVGAKLI